MAAPKSWQRKALLLFKSEKRLNAGKIIKGFDNKSSDEMKATTITESMCDLEAISSRPRIKDLQSHLDNLKHQFVGQSELCFYHTTLVVLLRRGYKITETFADFETLWATEADYLLKHLSLRWIISACDTFIDHSPNPTRKAILMNATTLINTLRIYETKHFLHTSCNNQPLRLVQEHVEALYNSDLPLYEGLTYFRIGTDDTLKHMRERYESFYDADELATTILLFMFDKLQHGDSAFATVRALHKDHKTQWWSDPL